MISKEEIEKHYIFSTEHELDDNNKMLKEYIQQLETKEQKVVDKLEELKKEYKEALETNSINAFILKCQIEILEEIMKGEE